MQALVIVDNSTLKLVDTKPRALGAHELRVAVAVSAVCGSDLKIIARPFRPGEQIPGHEFAGRVIESFDGKTLLGERVTAFPMFSCLDCDSCRSREFRDCNRKRSLGYDLQGSFAEEVIVDSRFAVPLRDEISNEEGALVEHLCCGLRLAKEVEKLVQPSDRILIVGDGPMALADLRFLKMRGYHNITLAGKHQERMSFAMGLGAKEVLPFEELMGSTDGPCEFDALLYAVNNNAVIDDLYRCLKTGVKVFPQARISEIYMNQLAEKCGAIFGRAFAYHIDDFTEMMDLMVAGDVKANELISRRIELAEVDKATSLLFEKNSIKTLIVATGCV